MVRCTLCTIILFFVTGASLARAQSLPTAATGTDQVDRTIEEQMKRRGIPGLSLAIIQDGKIVKAKGYGFADRDKKTPVTASTLFQAGSISKSVAALGALHLVEEGKLSLDEDVNHRLKTWKVPENSFTREKKVTLRRLLSHTAGLTVHGFPGYAVDGADSLARSDPRRQQAGQHPGHSGGHRTGHALALFRRRIHRHAEADAGRDGHAVSAVSAEGRARAAGNDEEHLRTTVADRTGQRRRPPGTTPTTAPSRGAGTFTRRWRRRASGPRPRTWRGSPLESSKRSRAKRPRSSRKRWRIRC